MFEFFYKVRGIPVPYYAKYPLWLLLWKPVRKFINVVIIPNTPFSKIRIFLYRIIGFKIGKNVFIGMKCYMDDIDPERTIIESNVVISYGCYFAVHGKGQGRSSITIGERSFIGLRSIIFGKGDGIKIGKHAIIGAGSLVNKSIPDYATAVGVPAKVIKISNPKENNTFNIFSQNKLRL